MEASEMIEALRARNPHAVELAKAVSIATRVEPHLLRRVRIDLLSQAGAGADAEADLWFSSLVESRSPVGLVLVREVAEALREELKLTPKLLEDSWQLIKSEHRNSQPTIQLEERLVRLLLAGEDDESTKPASEEIEELLHTALAGLASEKDALGIARWALRALPRLPREAQDSSTCEALALGTGAHLGGRRVLENESPGEAALEKLRWVLPPEATAVVGVRLLDNGIEFSEPPAAGAHQLRAPKTNPLVFELITTVRLPPPIDSSIPGIDPLTGEPFSDFDANEFGEGSSGGSSSASFRERVRQSRRGGRPFGTPTGEVEEREQVVARVSLPLGRTHVEPVNSSDLLIRNARGDTFALRPVSVEQPKTDYWFYLSYSLKDAADQEYLHRFFDDLTNEIRLLAGIPSDVSASRIGFISPTSGLPEEITGALNNCRAFICLLTPDYAHHKTKGREFQFFLTRLEQMPRPSAGVPLPPLIFPVVWNSNVTPVLTPRLLRDIEWFYSRGHHGVGDLLRQNGGDEYLALVADIARKVVEHAREYHVPPLEHPPPLSEIKNAFESPPESDRPDAGPRTALFVYVVGVAQAMKFMMRRKDGLLLFKHDTRYYGNDAASAGEQWRPFMPESEEPVLLLTQNITRSLQLEHERFATAVTDGVSERDLLRRISKAAGSNNIVIILIDPWALLLPPYRNLMKKLGNMTLRNCAVLVLRNEKDEDLVRGGNTSAAMTKEVKETLGKWKFGGTSDLVDVHSAEELKKVLTETLMRLRERLIRNAEVIKSVPIPESRPSITNEGPEQVRQKKATEPVPKKKQ